MTTPGKIPIICPNCRHGFRERATKIRGDAKLPCPSCGTEIVFDAQSSDESIRRALSAARRARLAGGS